jgi:hypothetical protein
MTTSLSKKDRQGLMLIAGVIALVVIAFAFSYYRSNEPKLDERSCPADIARSTAIVIDRSDDTPAQTLDEIVARTKRFVAEQVQQGELVSLFEISGSSRTSLEPVFSACVPQRDGNDLYENRRKIQRLFAERFAKPLNAALAAKPVKSETSPISEAITDLSASQYLTAPANRLIIFSDLMQNSANVSLYGCTSAKSAIGEFRAHRSGAIERPTFRNTAVELNLIPREGIGPNTVACREGFWAWFFGDDDGPEASLTSRMLPGGARVQ